MNGSQPAWPGGRTPNDIEPKAHIRIKDKGYVIREEGNSFVGEMLPWAWTGPQGKPVFNFVSEARDFSNSDRCLILATGFYEYTAPVSPKIKLKDQHLFTLKAHDWFWIAGIVKHYAFAMLTTAPGADMRPYHDRQVVVLPPDAGRDWLKSAAATLEPPPAGTFVVRTLRRNGVAV